MEHITDPANIDSIKKAIDIVEDNSGTINNNNEDMNQEINQDINNSITDNNNSDPSSKKNSNLISLGSRTLEERQRIGRLGGIKSGESRRKKRNAQQILQELLNQDMPPEMIAEILGGAAALLGDNKTCYDVMLLKAFQQACDGDIKAAALIRDTAGDKPIERQEVANVTMTEKDRQLVDDLKKALIS